MKTNLIVVFVILLCGAATRVQAQGTIAYYNPEPDIFYYASGDPPLNLDINGDGSKDLQFRYNSASIATPLRSGSIISTREFATALQVGAVVGADTGTNAWFGSGSRVASAGSIDPRQPELSGQFYRLDGYMGFQLVEGGQSYYGWMHVSNYDAPGASLYIKEWAYNTVAGQPITVGQVPEPASISLLGLGCLLLWRGGRRQVAG